MLQPISVTLTAHRARPVVIACYIADDGMAQDAGVQTGDPVYLAFYRHHDLADMQNLFYPGDRVYYASRQDALGEIDRCGFDD